MTATDPVFQTAADFLHTTLHNARLDLTFAAPDDPDSEPGILTLHFFGPDTPLLTARNGELLLALEHLCTQVLRLTPDQHHRVSFDADSFKAQRHLELQQQAATAIASVRDTGKPYAFAPMSSRERRLLHLSLVESGLPTSSSGIAPRRHVVLYPTDHDTRQPDSASPTHTPAIPTNDRVAALRKSFSRR